MYFHHETKLLPTPDKCVVKVSLSVSCVPGRKSIVRCLVPETQTGCSDRSRPPWVCNSATSSRPPVHGTFYNGISNLIVYGIGMHAMSAFYLIVVLSMWSLTGRSSHIMKGTKMQVDECYESICTTHLGVALTYPSTLSHSLINSPFESGL